MAVRSLSFRADLVQGAWLLLSRDVIGVRRGQRGLLTQIGFTHTLTLPRRERGLVQTYSRPNNFRTVVMMSAGCGMKASSRPLL